MMALHMEAFLLIAIALVSSVVGLPAYSVSEQYSTALAGQRFLSQTLPLPDKFYIGSHSGYDFTDNTNNGFQIVNVQRYNLFEQVFDLGAEALTIDLHFIQSLGTGEGVSADQFRVCSSGFPRVDRKLFDYCNADDYAPGDGTKTVFCGPFTPGRGANWDECGKFGVYDYGVYHTGCGDSDTLTFGEFLELLLLAIAEDPSRLYILNMFDYTVGYSDTVGNATYDAAIVDGLNGIIEEKVGDIVYRNNGTFNSTTDSWPSTVDIVQAGKHIMLFTNNPNTTGEYLWDGNEHFVVNTDVEPPYPDCDPTQAASQFYFSVADVRVWAYYNLVANVSCRLFDSEVSVVPISAAEYYRSCDQSVLYDRLNVQYMIEGIWAFPDTGISSQSVINEKVCFALYSSTERIDSILCKDALPNACRADNDPYDWLPSPVRIDPLNDEMTCPPGYFPGWPRNPSEMQAIVFDMQTYFNDVDQPDWVVYLNLFVTPGNCFDSQGNPDPLCIIVVPETVETDNATFIPVVVPVPIEDDDDLSDGEIAAIVILTVLFGVALLALLIAFIMGAFSGSQVYVGSGPARSLDNPDA